MINKIFNKMIQIIFLINKLNKLIFKKIKKKMIKKILKMKIINESTMFKSEKYHGINIMKMIPLMNKKIIIHNKKMHKLIKLQIILNKIKLKTSILTQYME